MKVSIQCATLGDHGIGYGLLVKTFVRRNSLGTQVEMSLLA
jgi:hypothetical protein